MTTFVRREPAGAAQALAMCQQAARRALLAFSIGDAAWMAQEEARAARWELRYDELRAG